MSSTEIIYGINPVIEMLRAGRRRCHEVIIAEGRKEADAGRVRDEAARRGAKIKTVSRDEMSELCGTGKNQGIAARCDPYPYSGPKDIIVAALRDPRKGFVLILDGITDPQNLGSLVRTSHLMGVHGVIIPKDNAASITPVVVKASAGATEYQKIAQVTNIAVALLDLKDNDFWVFGADGSSKNLIYSQEFNNCNVAVAMGAEGRGLRRLVKERCDQLLSIPMEGVVGSYNVSVAGALFMAEVVRSRWFSSSRKNRTEGL